MKKVLLIFFLVATHILLPTAIFANDVEKLLPSASLETLTIEWEAFDKEPTSTASLSEQQVEDQIIRIDQEILVLKAELAQKYSHFNELENYLTQLDKMTLLPMFHQRVVWLKQALFSHQKIRGGDFQPETQSHLMVTGIQPLKFHIGDKETVMAVLLPLTGSYEEAGYQLLESVTDALERIGFLGSLVVLDTAIYESAFEIWQALKYDAPHFIFGPLRKSMAQQWHALNTGVSTLYFNEMKVLHGYERALSPSKLKGMVQTIQFLQENQYQNVLVLTDETHASQALESSFYTEWQSQNEVGSYQHQSVEKTVGEAIELVSHIKRSKQRHQWLQKIIASDLFFKPRARQDLDIVVSFLSKNKAIQLAPVLDFYHLESLPRIWYPPQNIEPDFLSKNPSSWQNSYIVLPAYREIVFPKSASEERSSKKTGLFYALGQVAVEIVSHSEISDGLELYVETQFGTVISNTTGQFYLLPQIYSIDKAQKISVLDN